jgi:hypothetical protein
MYSICNEIKGKNTNMYYGYKTETENKIANIKLKQENELQTTAERP